MTAADAKRIHFLEAEILTVPALFTTLRVDRSTVPPGMYLYELRRSGEDQTRPDLLGEHIREDYMGAVLTASPIDLPQSRLLELEPEALNFYVGRYTVAQFETKYLSPRRSGTVRHPYAYVR